MLKLLGSVTMVAALALAGAAVACDLHQSASTDSQQVTTAAATTPPSATDTTTTTLKTTRPNTGG